MSRGRWHGGRRPVRPKVGRSKRRPYGLLQRRAGISGWLLLRRTGVKVRCAPGRGCPRRGYGDGARGGRGRWQGVLASPPLTRRYSVPPAFRQAGPARPAADWGKANGVMPRGSGRRAQRAAPLRGLFDKLRAGSRQRAGRQGRGRPLVLREPQDERRGSGRRAQRAAPLRGPFDKLRTGSRQRAGRPGQGEAARPTSASGRAEAGRQGEG